MTRGAVPQSVERPAPALLRWRFPLLAAVLALLFVVVGSVEYLTARAGFAREMREGFQAMRTGMETALAVTELEMLHMATFIASDPEVQRLMRQAHAEVEAEGGGAGGTRAATVRAQLVALLGGRWEEMRSRHDARQLHFHLAPGALSFLRVHAPQRFGDRLDEVRPLVAAVNSDLHPRSGFEVGRIYSGVRGVHPIVVRGMGGVAEHVGSVEVGVSFREVIAQLAERFDARFAVTLARNRVEGVMWPDSGQGGLRLIESCDCYLEAESDPAAGALLAQEIDAAALPFDAHRLVLRDGHWYGVIRIPLFDYRDRIEGVLPGEAAGAIYVFADRTEALLTHERHALRMPASLFLIYCAALVGLWLLQRGLARAWGRRIADTEEALESAQRFSSALFNLAPDALMVTDRDGTIVEVNPRFSEATGYPAEEVIGRKPSILKSGQMPESVYREMWERLAAGEPWQGDLLNRRKDGTLYWDAHSIVPVRDASGEVVRYVSFQRDITWRREQAQALAASERLYRSIYDNVQEAIFLIRVEADGFLFVGSNPQHERATGIPTTRLRGLRPHDLLPAAAADAVCANYRRCVDAGRTIRYEETLDLPAGTRTWLTSLAPVRDDDGVVELIVGLSVDITEQKAIHDELRRLATTDVLTGLVNRRHFFERAEQELARVRRYGEPAALILLDADHFKRINDTWGHGAGDEVLRRLAAVLREVPRITDLAGRLGGEEFGVLLPATDLEAARVLAERLREAMLAQALEIDGETVRFSASFGVTVLHPEDDSFDTALARADAALYAAKFAGRNRVRWRER